MDTITLGYTEAMLLDGCESGWEAATDVTLTYDTATYVVGASSMKVATGYTVNAGTTVAHKDLPFALDLSDMTAITLWVKHGIATPMTAGDFTFILGAQQTGGMEYVSFNFPALTSAQGWIQLTFPITSSVKPPSWFRAVNYIGVKMVVDRVKLVIFWIDDIRATLPSTEFDVLSVKGVDQPDSVRFPRAVKYEDLAGNSVVRFVGFKRMPQVSFAAITDEAKRTALFRWLYRGDNQCITYNGETLGVVLYDIEGYELEWMDEVSFLTGFTVNLEEKTTRQSIPLSWIE